MIINMKKDKIIAIVVFIAMLAAEILLIVIGSMLWGRDKAYHIWGNANLFLLIAFAIGKVVFNIIRNKKK